jgi:hypothetical protein
MAVVWAGLLHRIESLDTPKNPRLPPPPKGEKVARKCTCKCQFKLFKNGFTDCPKVVGLCIQTLLVTNLEIILIFGIWKGKTIPVINPCGGGVEYLHREPASRKRRRNGTKKGCAIA